MRLLTIMCLALTFASTMLLIIGQSKMKYDPAYKAMVCKEENKSFIKIAIILLSVSFILQILSMIFKV